MMSISWLHSVIPKTASLDNRVRSIYTSTSSTGYKWKNHFSEMKGDVGMSLHEKEGEQEDAYTETGSH